MNPIEQFVHEQQHRNDEYHAMNYVKSAAGAAIAFWVLRSIWRWPLAIGKVALLGALAYVVYVLATTLL